MELRRGITGFRRADDPPLPVSDLRAFRADCFDIARSLNGRVREVPDWPRDIAANYATAVLDLPAGQIAALLNEHFPVLALAEPHHLGTPIRFIDDPGLAEAFRATGRYEVADRSELERPVTSDRISALSAAELRQLRYWRPPNVGHVVFNTWD